MIRGSAGGIRRPPGRVEGPCRAAESASSAPHRQDSARVALRPPSRRVEPVRGTRVGTRPRTERRLEIDPPRRRGGAWQGLVSAAGGMDTAGAGSRNGAPEGRLGFSRGIRRPLGRVEGPCSAAESASSTLHRQDFGPGWRCGRRVGASSRSRAPVWARDRERSAAWELIHPRRRVKPSQRVGSRLLQSRPNPRGGSTLSSSPRSSAQIASSLSASAVSWSASGRLSSHS